MDEREVIEQNKAGEPLFSYSNDSGAWVSFGTGGKKKKLRRYVRDMAIMINKVNGRGDTVNRDNIILNYNYYGMDGIKKYLTTELTMVEKVVN